MNKVILCGNLATDPELKHTQSGKAVASFSIATTNYDKSPEYHRIILWDKLAENCAQYLKKGSKALVEGEIHTRSWDDNGVKRYITEITALKVEFLSKAENLKASKVVNDLDGQQIEDDLPF